ncbi:uncharacterized protein GlcG (DUF336 family) [Bosea psychrotolerans]|uniref:Uncharacterized protein GlcG (DUF336 family) n=1 Tax=Bosea psychrotolerans TaxID=1871628 RepID=A0A2S4M8B0_9HYPH|nr:uncharacterized protein GlcG (DUF336 family) [Bosea psychrotolerans]
MTSLSAHSPRNLRSCKLVQAVIASTFVSSLSLVPSGASAQVQSKGYNIPLSLAIEAALEGVRACEANGYKVSVAVVDTAGEMRAFVKGDHSTVHTKTSSFRKAYTVATLGPVFGFDALGVFTEKVRTTPNASALASLPDVILLAGGVAIKARGEIVAAIGVGGAPGGDKDEVCAQAGLAKIKDRLPN